MTQYLLGVNNCDFIIIYWDKSEAPHVLCVKTKSLNCRVICGYVSCESLKSFWFQITSGRSFSNHIAPNFYDTLRLQKRVLLDKSYPSNIIRGCKSAIIWKWLRDSHFTCQVNSALVNSFMSTSTGNTTTTLQAWNYQFTLHRERQTNPFLKMCVEI